MTMKKTLIASAVAGALAVPMAAQAGGYGRLAIGINMPNEDAAGEGLDDIAIQDVSSYFGFRGEDDLGNGMTGFFDYQFDVGGADGEIRHDTTRQSHIGLRGDFGSVKLGTQTEAFYEHVGVLTDWGWVATAPTYYSLTYGDLNADGDPDGFATLYARSSIGYQGGSGPVSFSVTLDTDNDDGDATDASEDFDAMYLGGTFDFGQGTVSVAHQSQSNATGAEPSLLGVGVTYDVGQVGLRGAYYSGDSDDDAVGDQSGFDLLAHTSFGDGLSGYVGVSMLDADADDDAGDATYFWGNITRSLSSRTSLYAEVLTGTEDGGAAGEDLDPTTISVGAIHTF